MTTETALYIVTTESDTAIFAGGTREECERQLRDAGVTHDPATGEPVEYIYTPATPALVAADADTWDVVGGVACLPGELGAELDR